MNSRRLPRISILGLCLLLAPITAGAQGKAGIPTVGVLELNSEERPTPALPSFRKGLRDLGRIEGQNVLLEARYAGGRAHRFPVLAAALVERAPDVIWLHTNPAAHAARSATKTIPIVVAVAVGLVEDGLVASLAKPGGNLTGLELPPGEVSGRRLELLKEALPGISRVAVLVDPGWLGSSGVPRDLEREALALGIELQRVEAGSLEAFDKALVATVRGKADALLIMKSALFAANRHHLLELAIMYRLPTMSFALPFAEAGSLLAYGTDPRAMSYRSALYVDKILKGANPADLPVERASAQLIVNLETARQLGVKIPPVVLYRADRVIR